MRQPARRTTRNPKTPMRAILIMLRQIVSAKCAVDALAKVTRTSRATVYRMLADCERELGMRIDCSDGIYSVSDWGVLNWRRVTRGAGQLSR